MIYIITIGMLIVAYLLGSIPTGLLLGKMKGIDIREHGSKNIGTTNAGRVLGRKYAIYTYILDTLKGAIIVFLFRFEIIPPEYSLISPLFYGLAAALGHTFSIYLKFKGGKAVATSGGVLFGFAPWLLGLVLIVFFITTYITKYVSAGSMVAATSALITTIILAIVGHDPFFTSQTYDIYFPILTFIFYLIIMIRHKANIKRIINKTESKVSW